MQKYPYILEEIRLDNKKTQKEMADIINTSQQYYGQYELGKRKLPFDHAITIATHFDISLDYLAGLTDNPKNHKIGK